MIFWLLLTMGLTLVVANSLIAAPLRRLFSLGRPTLAHFWRCPMCVGWWVGLALGLLGIGPAEATGWPLLGKAFADAFCSAAWCWTMHVMLAWLGANDL